MPTYRYKCETCGYTFDVFQKMNDDPLTTCEQCGGLLKKLVTSGAGFILKGEGFYVNDYKKKQPQNPATEVSHTKNNPAPSNKE